MLRARLSVGLALTASLMAAGLIAAPPAAAAPKCFGMAATIVGTGGGDDLFGTGGVDVIVGLGGKDLLVGFGGNDRLCGGKGADDIDSGAGKDKVKGGAGNDVAFGVGADDLLLGGGGGDVLVGGAKKDTLKGGGGFDILFGEGGNDTLKGGGNSDILIGEKDNDVLDGDAGEDMGSFVFSTNPAGITASLVTGIATGEGTDTMKQVEGIEGSFDVDAPDRFTGNAQHNFFRPFGGDDVIDGAGADDLLILAFAPQPVTVDLQAQTATGEGSDALTSIEMATGTWDFGDSLTGSDVANLLLGLDGDDVIDALGGDDVLSGGNGTDTGDGGDGTDECISIENPTGCEIFGVTAAGTARPAGREGGAGPLPAARLWSLPPSY